eukprot:GEMP01032132.1.p1 GENE.GEMP01032132.1~~GEMP01032132.1.p1  ORF type:complete len:543 (+),score=77.92 GEMP01032132.1:62-1690(+)
MAFVTRSERRFAEGSTVSTGKSLGPGTYLGHKAYQKTVNAYAPFHSTTHRETEETVVPSCAPPPGHYDPKLPGNYESGLPKKYVPFKSTARRFGDDHEKKSDWRPGPGSYEIKGACSDIKSSHQTMGMSPGDRPSIRALSAPSIPARMNSFGYEEGVNGKLVQQRGPELLTGRNDNCAGPDHYYVDDRYTKKRVVGGHIPLTPRLDRQMKPSNTPGPGHYLERRLARPKRPGVFFVSKVSRLGSKSEKKNSIPGPGQYDPSFPSGNPRMHDYQFFGSTVERFSGKTRQAAPGPGSYQVAGQIGKNGAKGTLKNKSDRFKQSKKEAVPGPGQYEMTEGFGLDAENALNCQKSFSVLGNQGALAFGAMSCRFVRSAGGPREDPGPGAYEQTAPGNMYHSQPSSMFQSRTPKDHLDMQLNEPDRPPPGAYDPRHVAETAEVVRIPQKNEGFLTASDRFGANRTSKLDLGPGTYNPVLAGQSTFNRAMGDPARVGCGGGLPVGFTTCSNRFNEDDGMTASRPGPGEYNVEPNWVKKSYNCLFGEVL